MPESPPDIDAASGNQASSAADLAPTSSRRWRSGSLLRRLRRLAAITAFGLTVGAAVFWFVAPILASLSASMQMVAWVPEWSLVVAIAVPGLVAIACWDSRRGRIGGLLLVVALLIGPVFGASSREFRWFASPHRGGFRLVFLNAQDPSRAESEALWRQIEPLQADLLVFANSGFIAPQWRSSPGPTSTYASIKWLSPFMAAAREGSISLRTMSRRNQIRAVAVGFEIASDSAGGPRQHHLAAIDLPSDWELDRGVIMSQLVETIAGYTDDDRPVAFDLIVGDFNSTPRAPSRGTLEPRFQDAFELVGAGWGATWPRRIPMLRIDAVFARAEGGLRVSSVRTFDPEQGGHRGLIVDLAEAQPSISN